MKAKRIIVILGMHRSGTSAVSGAISRLGVSFSSENKLMPADKEVNAKGYYEHRELSVLNEQVLAALGSSWDDFRPISEEKFNNSNISKIVDKIIALLNKDFVGEPVFGLKDPRMCKLLPMWNSIFLKLGYEPVYMFVYRHPYAVFKSLNKRDGLSESKSNLLWLSYMLAAEKFSRSKERYFISYDTLLENPLDKMTEIATKLGLTSKLNTKQGEELLSFLSPSLRHNADETIEHSLHDSPWIFDTCAIFTEIITQGDTPECSSRLDLLVENFETALQHFDLLLFDEANSLGELAKLRIEMSNLIEVVDESEKARVQLNNAYSSTRDSYEHSNKAYEQANKAYEETRSAYDRKYEDFEHLSSSYEDSKSLYEETHKQLIQIQSSIFGKAYRLFTRG